MSVAPLPARVPTHVHVLIDVTNIAKGSSGQCLNIENLCHLVNPSPPANTPGKVQHMLACGSSPYRRGGTEEEREAIWEPFARQDYSCRVMLRQHGRDEVKEQGVDETIICQGYVILRAELQARVKYIQKMSSALALDEPPVRELHKLVIVTGDGNNDLSFTSFPELALNAVGQGFVVENWSWDAGRSAARGEAKQVLKRHGQDLVLRSLDPYADLILKDAGSGPEHHARLPLAPLPQLQLQPPLAQRSAAAGPHATPTPAFCQAVRHRLTLRGAVSESTAQPLTVLGGVPQIASNLPPGHPRSDGRGQVRPVSLSQWLALVPGVEQGLYGYYLSSPASEAGEAEGGHSLSSLPAVQQPAASGGAAAAAAAAAAPTEARVPPPLQLSQPMSAGGASSTAIATTTNATTTTTTTTTPASGSPTAAFCRAAERIFMHRSAFTPATALPVNTFNVTSCTELLPPGRPRADGKGQVRAPGTGLSDWVAMVPGVQCTPRGHFYLDSASSALATAASSAQSTPAAVAGALSQDVAEASLVTAPSPAFCEAALRLLVDKGAFTPATALPMAACNVTPLTCLLPPGRPRSDGKGQVRAVSLGGWLSMVPGVERSALGAFHLAGYVGPFQPRTRAEQPIAFKAAMLALAPVLRARHVFQPAPGTPLAASAARAAASGSAFLVGRARLLDVWQEVLGVSFSYYMCGALPVGHGGPTASEALLSEVVRCAAFQRSSLQFANKVEHFLFVPCVWADMGLGREREGGEGGSSSSPPPAALPPAPHLPALCIGQPVGEAVQSAGAGAGGSPREIPSSLLHSAQQFQALHTPRAGPGGGGSPPTATGSTPTIPAGSGEGAAGGLAAEEEGLGAYALQESLDGEEGEEEGEEGGEAAQLQQQLQQLQLHAPSQEEGAGAREQQLVDACGSVAMDLAALKWEEARG